MDAALTRPSPPAVKRPTREEAEAAVRTLIAWAGDDPGREGLLETPARAVRAYEELYAGYGQSPDALLERVFDEAAGYEDMVLVRDIPFSSHCEHHMIPFIGKAHIAYYPKGTVVGLSKLARVVDVFARRLQTQEALTAQVTQAIEETLRPAGVAVLFEGEHLCMSTRGIEKHGTSTVTTGFTGRFKDPAEQTRFLAFLRAGR